MTERKRQRRLKRRERRRTRYKRWVLFNSIAIALITLTIVGLYVANDKINQASYIEYVEDTDVEYSVKIPKDADFYKEYLEEFAEFADENGDLWIPKDYAYPTMAATLLKISFDYNLNVCSEGVDYAYTYRIIAQPEIIDGATKSKFPLPKTIIEESTEPISGNSNSELNFHKDVEINYKHYDQIVKDFEEKLEINDATENLLITLEVEVIGSSERFENNAENTCSIIVTMPLNENSFDITYSEETNHNGDCRILCRQAEGVKSQLVEIAKILTAVDIAFIIILVASIYIVKNKDITYYTKIQRLVTSYRSFIQKVENNFDATGYQIIIIASFREMLSIRDTIQSPILMSENSDKTRCQFFIPTNTKIIYLFEVKVDDYDKLYSDKPDWQDDCAINTNAIVNGVVVSEKAETAPAPTKTRILKLRIASTLFDGHTVVATTADGTPCKAKVDVSLDGNHTECEIPPEKAGAESGN